MARQYFTWFHFLAPVLGLVCVLALSACDHHVEEKSLYPDTSDLVGVDQALINLAKEGVPSAQTHLGWMYGSGHGVVKDMAKAITWYALAAKNGDRIAQFNLGVIYGNGQGVIKDLSKAAYWYRKSADLGLRDAQYSIGGFYDRGFGVPIDHKVAVHWYQLAADQDLPIAEYALGVSYYKGEGVIQDDAKAAYWYRKAAEHGFVSAMASISDMCQHGQGVKRDLVCAYQWLALDLKIVNEHPDNPGTDKATVVELEENFRHLENQLTPAQREKADAWFQDWLAAHR